MLNLAKNPIYQRLITPQNNRLSFRYFIILALLTSSGSVALSLYLATNDQLSGNSHNITFIAGPIAAFLLFLIATTGAILTVKQSRGEAFQLLRLTDFPSSRIVWAYVGATFYRTRLFWWIFVWLFPLAMLPIFLDVYDYANRVQNDSAALLTTPTRAHRMEIELVIFWIIGLIAATGFSFLTVTGTITAALKRRAIVRGAISSILITLTTILIGTFLLLLTVSVTQNVLYILFAALLACLPYIFGLFFCRWNRANPAILITNTIYVPFIIFFVIVLALVSTSQKAEFLSTFWLAGSTLIGIVLAVDVISSWRQPNSAAGAVVLAWYGVLTVVAWITLNSNAIQEDGVIFLWLIVFSLIISLYGYALLNIERAKQFLWNPRYYF